MTISELSKQIHENARNKGFWDKERNLGEMLMLIVSEVSEAMEADRKNHFFEGDIEMVNKSESKSHFEVVFTNYLKGTFEDELADVCIRIFDLAYSKGINLEAHIQAKMRYNESRPHMHGKKY
jgi:NTP pyrophosphatase (non-canonical NTP hydrolase)